MIKSLLNNYIYYCVSCYSKRYKTCLLVIYMEPLSIVTISASVGGVSGKLVEKIWELAEKIIKDRYKNHSKEVINNGSDNCLRFVQYLANRLEELKSSVEEIGNRQLIFESFKSPQLAIIIENALIGSTETSIDEKHKIFARIVADRLLSGSETLESLTCDLACNAARHLTQKQLHYLGIVSFLNHNRITIVPYSIPNKMRAEWYVDYLKVNISYYLPLDLLNEYDYLHLVSLSCLNFPEEIDYQKDFFISGDYFGFDTMDLNQEEYKINKRFFADFYNNDPICEQINKHIRYHNLTTIGLLLGTYVHDEISNNYTKLKWY